MKKKLLAYLSLFVLFVLFMPCANAKEIADEISKKDGILKVRVIK